MTALPAIPASAVPAQVREEGGAATYKAALGFESMLLDQLSDQLVQDAGLGDSPYGAQMTGAFSQSLLQGGGIGLAGALYASLKERSA